jgi:hypothetical protein
MSRWFQVFGPCPDCRRLRAALAAERAAREKAEAELKAFRKRFEKIGLAMAQALDKCASAGVGDTDDDGAAWEDALTEACASSRAFENEVMSWYTPTPEASHD